MLEGVAQTLEQRVFRAELIDTIPNMAALEEAALESDHIEVVLSVEPLHEPDFRFGELAHSVTVLTQEDDPAVADRTTEGFELFEQLVGVEGDSLEGVVRVRACQCAARRSRDADHRVRRRVRQPLGAAR